MRTELEERAKTGEKTPSSRKRSFFMRAGTKVLSIDHLEEDSDDSEGLNRSLQVERMFSGSPMVVDPLPRRS